MRLHVAGTQRPETRSVTARAPGKVNLALLVDRLGEDGYHRLVSVFQAVSLYEDVEARPGDGISITVRGPYAHLVPTDRGNIAWRAAELLAARVGMDPDVHLTIDKGVPVAGGMAGGSADAAATLVACDALWNTGLPRQALIELAAELGSDVPFCLVGHTAIGTGTGTELSPAMTRGEFHWAFGMQNEGMSTGAVYRAFDRYIDAREAAGEPHTWAEEPPTDMMHALRAGDSSALGLALRNSLQAPALEMNSRLEPVIDAALEAGALGAIVSGSGPTVAALAPTRRRAQALAAAMTESGVVDSVTYAVGGVPGARIIAQS